MEDFLLVMMFQGWVPRKSSVMSVEEKSSKALKKKKKPNKHSRIFCTSSDKSLLYPAALILGKKEMGEQTGIVVHFTCGILVTLGAWLLACFQAHVFDFALVPRCTNTTKC